MPDATQRNDANDASTLLHHVATGVIALPDTTLQCAMMPTMPVPPPHIDCYFIILAALQLIL